MGRRTILAVVAVLALGGSALALFGKNVLFSSVSGTVMLDGRPVAGAEVVQAIDKDGPSPLKRTTRTAADGSFTFDEVTRSRGLGAILPSAFIASQELTIVHDGREVTGWLYGKRDPAPNAEAGGRPFRLVCDIGSEPAYEGKSYGVCRLSG
jgi:hypothetical protein